MGAEGYGLAYVAIVVEDVEAVAATFEDGFGLRRSDCSVAGDRRVPLFSVGASALALFAPADPFLDEPTKPGVHHIALAAAEPETAARAHRLPVVPESAAIGLDGARQVILDPVATGGVRTRLCQRPSLEPFTPGPVERIDHLGVASADNERAIAVFSDRLGCPVESRQTDMEVQLPVESFTSDKYGVVYHSRPPVPLGGFRVAFVTVGDCELELLQPIDPSPAGGGVQRGGPGTTRQDRGAVGRFIERRGPGLHHLALKTGDINATLARLEAGGLSLIDTTGRPGSRRALIGFIHPSALGGLLVHLVQRDEL